MSHKRFRDDDGQEWEATPADVGVGWGSGEYDPPANQWSITLRCISDPSKPTVTALVHESDPKRLSDRHLLKVLRRALSTRERG